MSVKTKPVQVGAGTVIRALEARHREDVTLAELVNGRRRMDFWALKRTWSPITSIGYEVKVTRRDFLQDDKWHDYRSMVHEFYFACPWKLIQPEELPEGVGLLWLNNGGRLHMNRKAIRQEPESDEFINCLIRKCWGAYGSGTNEHMRLPEMSLTERAEYHARRLVAREMGRHSAFELGKKRGDAYRDMQRRAEAQEDRSEKLERIAEWCAAHGIDTEAEFEGYSWRSKRSISEQLESLLSGIDNDLLDQVGRLGATAREFEKAAKDARAEVERAAS